MQGLHASFPGLECTSCLVGTHPKLRNLRALQAPLRQMGEPVLPPAPRWKGRGARKAARASPMGAAIQRLRSLSTQAPELSGASLRVHPEHRSVDAEHGSAPSKNRNEDLEDRRLHSEHRIRALAVGAAALAHVDSRQLGALGDAAFGRLAASSACCGCNRTSCPDREDCLLVARVSPGPHFAGTTGSTGEGRAKCSTCVRIDSGRDGAGIDRPCNEEPCCSAPAAVGDDSSSSASAGRGAPGCSSPVVHHDVHLSLEEAFFLQHALGALEVFGPCAAAHGWCSTGDRQGQRPLEAGAATGRGEGAHGVATSKVTQRETSAQVPEQRRASLEGSSGAASLASDAAPEGEVGTTDVPEATNELTHRKIRAEHPSTGSASSESHCDTFIEAYPDGVPQVSAESAEALQTMSPHEQPQASTETVLMHLQPMSAPELWSLGTRAHPQFGVSCVGFWHLRAKNWVLRGGAQYGADFTAYQQHPNLVHSSYLVFVSRAQSSIRAVPALAEARASSGQEGGKEPRCAPLGPGEGQKEEEGRGGKEELGCSSVALESATRPGEPWRAPGGGLLGEGQKEDDMKRATQPAEPRCAPLEGLPGEGRVRQWEDFQALVRVAASVAKRVLLLRVTEVAPTSNEVRGGAALLEGGSHSRVAIPGVGSYEVLEIEVHRWLAERGREAHEY